MRPYCIPVLLAALAACAAPQPAGGDRAFERELATRAAGPPEDCVPASPGGAGLTIVARGTVGYQDGRTWWVNRLAGACVNMEPSDSLAVEAHVGQYCRGDHVRALEPGRSIAGPVCILGPFIPYRAQ
ncbi:MAG: hypothetical protein QOJ94_3339 [Sphingomonadales bacterium]|jgi:hypothetical protein|nr:hypothetical protein [Sphingomonadales bacterium]